MEPVEISIPDWCEGGVNQLRETSRGTVRFQGEGNFWQLVIEGPKGGLRHVVNMDRKTATLVAIQMGDQLKGRLQGA